MNPSTSNTSLIEPDLDNFILNLPSKEEPNLMDDYRRRRSYEPPDDITPLIQQLKENQSNYLNFDFNINDLKAYLFKHIIMRAERTLIQRALEEKKQQIGLNPANNFKPAS